MVIIPAINCKTFDELKERLSLLREFPEKPEWIQIDVADGIFTNGHITWRDFSDLETLDIGFNLEVHIMEVEPEETVDRFLELRAKRIILHLESRFDLEGTFNRVKESGAELMLAIKPESDLDDLSAAIDQGVCDGVQILAVDPGLSGQSFNEEAINKIISIKEQYPDLLVEVDGGINLEKAGLCKSAGADQLVVGSAIFEAEDLFEAYKALTEV
ncbi:MAG: hypothetical protein COU09_01745 [Candidatus Harrisonbacteria bacterium CG10_big_fil_rev_8_21_14_0_10_44_23]|uniref:Ribulose-phosphate 3-epimerase n=1 Tax=Candidatus Harrisonbacteria bacterium CG10_big_fil_rev_8_21_14_0_10_44_23 TaxID=1974585 RepID=A0A2H0UQ82_9BACT|nr:MAG: hypothetical protein COU09_01745 [Candidatus Harrisonbacteria bacterium CG10_big_fil_rev_8_21_14_0_10_44_23]